MPERELGRYTLLVERLVSATSTKRIQWEPGFASNTFVAVLEGGSVRISRHEESLDDIPTEWFELDIRDRDGRTAERLSSEPHLTGDDATGFDKLQLATLFRSVRTHALAADKLVDSLIGELD